MFDPDTYYRPNDPKLRQYASMQTLANWRHQRRGPKYFRFGRRILYKGCDLNAFFAEAIRPGEVSQKAA